MSGTSRSRVVFDMVDSPALRGNPLSDPHARRLPIYLPPGYRDDGTIRYPTAYVLGAIFVSGEMLLAPRPFEENLRERLDRLIDEKRVPPMIVALPDARSRYGTGQYLDSPAVGKYAGFVLDVVAHIDAKYPTRAERGQRAVLGKSSGGYGAMMFGMRRPDVFGLVADHSGDKGFDWCYRPHVPQFLDRSPTEDAVAAAIADLPALYARAASPMDFFHAINIPAMAACYSPDPESRLGFQLPVDLYTGEWRPSVWARWLTLDPAEIAVPHAEALRSLKLLYFDCGDRDEHYLYYGCRLLSKRLHAARVSHRYEEYRGTHQRTDHRYDTSFEAIASALDA